ncbi:MAG: class V aminotransferase [Nitrospira bacterium SG8_35_4]|nr:MAG: class V aminotransferase [Nitrospira bacterium SG8_35_4]
MLHNLDGEFRLSDDLIYLNHAGVSPWPARTAEAVKNFADENMVHGSRRYLQWLEREAALRAQACELLNAPSPDDIALLKNTSEALSAVAYGLEWQEGDNIVTTNQEFPSNRIVWESLSSKGVDFREADPAGFSQPEDALFSLADSDTRLITVSSVQFSTGLRMDLEKIGEFCKSRGILFCIDAIQSLGALTFDVRRVHADFVMADGHKWMLGPEGLAIFYCTPEMRDRLTLHQYGWHMVDDLYNFDRKEWRTAKTARCFECGSPNMIGIHALHASLSLLLDIGMDVVEKELLDRTEYLFERIRSEPELELMTPDSAGRYAGIVTFRHIRKDNESIYNFLMKNNIMCAYRNRGIRLSPHFYTPVEQLDRVFSLLESVP